VPAVIQRARISANSTPGNRVRLTAVMFVSMSIGLAVSARPALAQDEHRAVSSPLRISIERAATAGLPVLVQAPVAQQPRGPRNRWKWIAVGAGVGGVAGTVYAAPRTSRIDAPGTTRWALVSIVAVAGAGAGALTGWVAAVLVR
jgi:drug/metabolite transporter (DMT)-like permease